MVEEYFVGSIGAIAVADVTRQETINQLDEIIKGYLHVAPDSNIVIVGNKIDLNKNKSDLHEKLLKYAKHKNLKPFFTSAKSGENVEAVFTYLGEKMAKFL